MPRRDVTLPDTLTAGALPDAEAAYLARVVDALKDHFGDRLIGVYLFGSAGYGAYEPGSSDLDVQAVIAEPLDAAVYEALAGRLSHGVMPCPARLLELVCYTRSAIDPASRHPRYELNFNTGRAIDDHLSLDPAEESSHWFLLDIAFGRELGRSLIGPPSSRVFAPILRLWCLEALADSLAWHGEHEPASKNSVLNACRGWRYASTGVFGSKRVGAEWARRQPGCPAVVDDVLRRGDEAEIDPAAVRELMRVVSGAVHEAMLREHATQPG